MRFNWQERFNDPKRCAASIPPISESKIMTDTPHSPVALQVVEPDKEDRNGNASYALSKHSLDENGEIKIETFARVAFYHKGWRANRDMANHIVKCVNSYPALEAENARLREALQGMLALFPTDPNCYHAYYNEYRIACPTETLDAAAVALSKGGTDD